MAKLHNTNFPEKKMDLAQLNNDGDNDEEITRKMKHIIQNHARAESTSEKDTLRSLQEWVIPRLVSITYACPSIFFMSNFSFF